MENTMKFFSPQSASGSVVAAILAHGLLYGTIVAILGIGFLTRQDVPQADTVLDYEVLNEPPAPTPVVQRVVRAQQPDTPVDTKVKPDHSPKELQDEKGTVAGTQTAPKAVSNVGSETNGTANSTPYYKIKPKYPRAALVAGTEGWIMLKIDITEKGDVENVRVIDGIQRSLFQEEARRAVEKWKYRPFLDAGGKPLRKADHQVRVDFKLTDV
jgi:protein TonB